MRNAIVYCAGKVRHNNEWRSLLMPHNRVVMMTTDIHYDEECQELKTNGAALAAIIADMTEPMLNDRFKYGGPVMFSCDHGCYHGENNHGAACTDVNPCIDTGDAYTKMSTSGRRQFIFNMNTALIRRADALFAWIDSRDAYGTLVEIGQAHQLGKFVFVAIDADLKGADDMWYATMCSTRRGGRFDCVEHAFGAFSDQYMREQQQERKAANDQPRIKRKAVLGNGFGPAEDDDGDDPLAA